MYLPAEVARNLSSSGTNRTSQPGGTGSGTEGATKLLSTPHRPTSATGSSVITSSVQDIKNLRPDYFFQLKNILFSVSEVAEWVKVNATKSDRAKFNPGTNMVDFYMHTYPHTYKEIKFN